MASLSLQVSLLKRAQVAPWPVAVTTVMQHMNSAFGQASMQPLPPLKSCTQNKYIQYRDAKIMLVRNPEAPSASWLFSPSSSEVGHSHRMVCLSLHVVRGGLGRCWVAFIHTCFTDLPLFDGFVFSFQNSTGSKQQVEAFLALSLFTKGSARCLMKKRTNIKLKAHVGLTNQHLLTLEGLLLFCCCFLPRKGSILVWNYCEACLEQDKSPVKILSSVKAIFVQETYWE